MTMKRCRECGFPYWLSKLIHWNENGTITMAVNPDYRVVIIESDFLSNLFARIEDSLGLSIAHLVFEAQRNPSFADGLVAAGRNAQGHTMVDERHKQHQPDETTLAAGADIPPAIEEKAGDQQEEVLPTVCQQAVETQDDHKKAPENEGIEKHG
jgi:hypothetical protein